MNRDSELEHYLTHARAWEADVIRRTEGERNRAYWIASAFGVLAALAMIAVVMLVPLKTVVPAIFRVDNSTGVVDVVPVYAGGADQGEAVTRYLLHAYVVAHERYVYAMAEADYALVGAMNAPELNNRWAAAWDRKNPASPIVLYRDGTTVRVQVKSVSFIQRADGQKDLAQVRFYTAQRPGGTGVEQVKHWIATLRYAYVEPAKDAEERLLNPLGFRVIDYRREPEVLDGTPEGAAGGHG